MVEGDRYLSWILDEDGIEGVYIKDYDEFIQIEKPIDILEFIRNDTKSRFLQ